MEEKIDLILEYLIEERNYITAHDRWNCQAEIESTTDSPTVKAYFEACKKTAIKLCQIISKMKTALNENTNMRKS